MKVFFFNLARGNKRNRGQEIVKKGLFRGL